MTTPQSTVVTTFRLLHPLTYKLADTSTEIITSQSTVVVTSTTGYPLTYLSIYLSIGINVRFAAMMADVGDGLL